jgi:DNA-binding NarL/FixJ family response regulator
MTCVMPSAMAISAIWTEISMDFAPSSIPGKMWQWISTIDYRRYRKVRRGATPQIAKARKLLRVAWPSNCTIYVQRAILFHKGTMRHASQDKVGIYLVAANRLLREALARVLRVRGGFRIVGACAPDADTENTVLTSGASMLLLDDFDAARADLTLLRKLASSAPALQVVLMGMPEAEQAFLDSVHAGAIGYVLHDASAEDVVASVRSVLNGEAVCPPQMIATLFRYVARQRDRMPNLRVRMELGLTRREQQLVPMIAQGMTNKEIAAHLNLSEQTIKNHVHRMLHRVGASDRLEVVDMVRVQGAYLD